MRPDTYEAAEIIDAAIFSGDSFHDKEARRRLRWYLERWERELKLFDQMKEEEEVPCTCAAIMHMTGGRHKTNCPNYKVDPKTTLGYHFKMAKALFGVGSPATQFLKKKIEDSSNGENEQVVCAESQLVYLLGQLHNGEIKREDVKL